MLLADVAPEPVPRAVRSPPLPVRRNRKRTTVVNGIDSAWDELRHEIRNVMRERDASYEDLAAAIGRSATTLKITLNRRLPASEPVIAGLHRPVVAGKSACPARVP
jgi:hypothetical protein